MDQYPDQRVDPPRERDFEAEQEGREREGERQYEAWKNGGCEVMPDVTIDVEVYCAICGEGLCNQTESVTGPVRQQPQFRVEPCERCLEQAQTEGYDKGWAVGYEEAEDEIEDDMEDA